MLYHECWLCKTLPFVSRLGYLNLSKCRKETRASSRNVRSTLPENEFLSDLILLQRKIKRFESYLESFRIFPIRIIALYEIPPLHASLQPQ